MKNKLAKISEITEEGSVIQTWDIYSPFVENVNTEGKTEIFPLYAPNQSERLANELVFGTIRATILNRPRVYAIIPIENITTAEDKFRHQVRFRYSLLLECKKGGVEEVITVFQIEMLKFN